jgi:tetratricopeptide (TPR) repeat protein
MSFRGLVRSLAASEKRREREARKRQRELERQQKLIARMEELERAAFEVEVYENYLDVLMSLHKECGPKWNWKEVVESSPPIQPERIQEYELRAKHALAEYRPGVSDTLLRRVESKKEALKEAVKSAIQKDEDSFQEALNQYQTELAEWTAFREIAIGILAGNAEQYGQAIHAIDPFAELSDLGSNIEIVCDDPNLIEATVYTHGEDVIPKETKSLLKSGKLSVKKMPKTKFYELYQDYVSGCLLRIARELFAALPAQMSIVTAVSPLLNTQTGHIENQPILSAAIPRRTLESLNFEYLDPSDSLANFVHNVNFRKTKGFTAVGRIPPSSLIST